ncbi:hypothetical protein ES319_D03G075400v1 [Gossypium barbadense]|uniref:DNA-directed RNA polymerase RpoA/D/Rpb3-type domain-containing protein n=2 Tax=Gossypium TaxID=3633 RepID=A0A5J5S2P9_GOSBA|nr:hypothetical protein ES319_D03G075400v1 [Gossypium barbadense]PPD99041.1 hypothetical protein GOBAR_DD03927 [Gossypium barbadense]TYG76049.1 hypothetical protein ES288_D03G082000v1 [Gossypium darwinii]
MERPIPKVGSHKNGCSSAWKSARRIPKGVIQVQASFNNTIVILTDVWVGNAIRAVVDQGQADTIGSAMRRASLGELEGTCITCAKSVKIPQEYSTIVGIQESVHEILMNLKEIVLSGNLYGPRNAFICAKGPGYVTAQDIILPPSVEIVDNTQHRNRVYDIKMPKKFQDRSYPIDVVFMLVRNANHCINCYGNDNEKKEMLFLEIWKNGSLTLKEALREESIDKKCVCIFKSSR